MNKQLLLLLASFCIILNALGQADIKVTIGATEFTSGASTFDFENVMVDYPITNYFLVENVGDADLTLSISNALSISGTDAAIFFIPSDDPSGEVIAPGGSIAFTLSFTPLTNGVKNATISIGSDDLDENPFTFSVTGTALSSPVDCTILTNGFESFQNGSAAEIDFGTGNVNNIFTYRSPSGWQPLIGQLFALFGQAINVTETVDARTGSKALELFSDGNGLGDVVTIFPCSTPYTSLKGYYKFSGAADDQATIVVSTGGGDEENRNNANTNTLIIDADQASYTQFDLPIKYDGTSVDFIYVSISLSNNGTSTSFKLDDLEFGPVTGVTVPSKPATPTFSSLTAISASVDWTAAFDFGSSITSYTLEQKEGPGGTFSGIYTGANLTFDVSSLTTGNSYFYRVKATNGIGDSDYSDEAELIPENILVMSDDAVATCDTKFADSGNTGNYTDNEDFTLTISPDSPSDKVRVSFNSFAVENFYDDLKVYDGPSTSASLIATLTGSSLPSDITATGSGGELTFRFTSDGSGNEAGWDATISCITPGSMPPNKPAIVTFDAPAPTSVTVNWTAPNDNGSAITGYVLEQKEGSGGSYSQIFSGTDLTFDITGLTTGIEYFYQVKATNVNGDSDYSDANTFIPDVRIVMTDGSETNCNAIFQDPGGSSDYAASLDVTTTFNPENSGDKVKINFTSFDLENSWDNLYVYDGPTTGSPLIATLTGTSIPADITASGSGGELTFNFISDGSGAGAGWEANISCFSTPNTETDITAFSFAEQTGAATIDATNHTVDIEVDFGTDVTSLVSTFTLSSDASAEVSAVAQTSASTANDFTSPVTYTITAEDGATTQDWMVTVTEAPSTETDITAFSFAEQTGAATIDATNHTVDIEVDFGTDVISLVSTFTLSSGASAEVSAAAQTSATTANDFTSPLTYTITAEDGATTQDWMVTVTKAPSTETDITAFSFAEQTGAATIDATNHTVNIEVDFGTDVISLVSTFTLSSDASAEVSAAAQTSATTANDFTSPVTYTITAEDGATTQDWMVTVTEAPSTETDITTFSFTEQTGAAAIDAGNHTVDIEVDFGTDVTTLVSTFILSSGASAEVSAAAQTSATTANDFTSPVTYTITAEDGATTQDWMVTVTEAPSTETDITTFSFTEQTGAAAIDAGNHTVDIEVDFGTDLTTLVSTFILSSGASAEVSVAAQTSATTANDFTNPVTYTITAEDGVSTQDWVVTVTEATIPSTETDITAFSLAEQTGAAAIDAVNHTVDIEVDFGTDVTTLVSTFTISTAANAKVSATAQTSTTTSNDFTNSVTYTITAEDGVTTQDWVVTVTEALNTETDITAFSFTEQTGAAAIDAGNHTVDIEVDFGTDLTTLVSTFILSSGASAEVSAAAQTSATTANDFISPVTYTIIAEDGVTTQDWVVTVTEAPSPSTETDITTFSLAQQTGAAAIDAVNHTVDIEVDFGTDVTTLVSTFTISTGANAKVSATAQTSTTTSNDFTNSVTYTITAEDGVTTQDWVVTVTEALNTETDITAFSFTEQTGAAAINATNHTIDIEVVFGTDVTALVSTFTLSPGAAAQVNATGQTSATSANDFTNSITYTISAADGIASKDWVVNVTIEADTSAPVADFPSLVEVTGQCSVALPMAPTATDNADGTITGETITGFLLFESTTITWTFTDVAGNSSTQEQIVTIEDVTAPVPDVAFLVDSNNLCSATPSVPTATDNCTGQIVGVPDVNLPITTPGTTIVTWTYDDENGNVTTQTQNVNVEVGGPVVDAVNLTDLTNECFIVAPTAPTSTDGCGVVISGVADVTFPIDAEGTTVITWTFDSGNGNLVTQTQNAIITPIDNTVSQNGNAIEANASGLSYQWVDCGNGNAPIANEVSQSFTPTTEGSYAVEISNGVCFVVSTCTNITIPVLGIDDEVSAISIFPNPVVDFLFIENPNSDHLVYHIADMSGRVFKSGKLKSKIDMSTLKEGIYVIIIGDGPKSKSFKFIRKN